MSGILSLTPGSSLSIGVGGQGSLDINPGGTGQGVSGIGGGATDIRVGGTVLAVAAGGGGGGAAGWSSTNVVPGGAGGASGGAGSPGANVPGGVGPFGGGGGTPGAGGAPGGGCGSFPATAGNTNGNGGDSFNFSGSFPFAGFAGGGGGGATVGGGGGGAGVGTTGCQQNWNGGGGGGAGGQSSAGSLQSASIVDGAVSGNGSALICLAAPIISIAPTTLPGGTSGAAYSQTLTVSGGIGPYTVALTAGALPSGLTLSAAGTISGTPAASGSFNFTVTATDDSASPGPYSGSRAYTLTIAAPTLTLAPASLPAASIGAAYSQSFAASGGTAPYSYAVTAGALPAGITLAADGSLSGTPTAGGSFNFTVTATDSSGGGGPFSVGRAYALTVNAPTIAVAPATLPGGTSGTAYSQTLTASGGTAPYGFAVTAGALPAGLTLTTAGTLSGTPTASGSFAFSVTATDATSGAGPFAGTRGYTLAIGAPTLTISPATLAGANIGAAYSQALVASGGLAPYSYAVTAGALPAGISLAADGTLSGTPTAGGSFSFTVTATDATSAGNGGPYTAVQAFTLAVGVPTIALAPTTLPGAQSGVAYSQVVSASGGTAPYSYAVTAGALPAGLTLAADGTLSGTPTASGSFAFTLSATDASAGAGPYTGSQAYSLAVALPAPPVARDSQQVSAAGSRTGNPQTTEIDLSALVTGEFTLVEIETPPSHGTATIRQSGSRFIAAYVPEVGYTGPDSFSFVAVGPGGRSAPATVPIDVTGSVPVAAAVSGATVSGQPVVVDLTAGAEGGPFTGAAIVSIDPADQVTATLIESGTPDDRSYQLRVVPDGRFAGTARVSYTLSNVFGTSAPGTVTIAVEERPDPSEDPNVRAIVAAQADSTRRFAAAQTDNFSRRNEQLHGNGAASVQSPFGITVSSDIRRDGIDDDGVPDLSDNGIPALAYAERDERGLLAAADASRFGYPGRADEGRTGRTGISAYGDGSRRTGTAGAAGVPDAIDGAGDGAGGRQVGSIAFWTGGAIAVGTRDETSNRAKLSATSGGLSAGADIKLNDRMTIGLGGGYGSDETKIGGGNARVEGENWVGALYGSYSPIDGIFIDGVAGAGTLSFDTRRSISQDGSVAAGSRDGSMLFGSIATGYEEATDTYRLSGYGRLEFLDAKLDAYEEQGGGLYGLAFDDRDVTSLSSVLGFRGEVAAGVFTPRLRAEWRHEFSDDGPQALDYTGLSGYNFTIDGDDIVRDSFSLEVGTNIDIGADWLFGFDVGGEFGEDSRVGTARLMVQKAF